MFGCGGLDFGVEGLEGRDGEGIWMGKMGWVHVYVGIYPHNGFELNGHGEPSVT